MLGSDSVVLRVNPDGSVAPFQRMPGLFFERALRAALTDDADGRFANACNLAIQQRQPVGFCPSSEHDDEVTINPILDRDGNDCRFLVCWVRSTDVHGASPANVAWEDLRLDQVTVRYRRQSHQGTVVIEAAPWWATPNGEVRALWPHHSSVSAMGLGHPVMETLIIHAAETAAENGGGPAVRLEIPSAEMLAGLVPVFHGALRASGVDPQRLIAAIDVELAVDPDLLPIIVHLRTFGLKIDIVGLDALSATLHTVSDTSAHSIATGPVSLVEYGEWTDSFEAAADDAGAVAKSA